MTREEHTGNGQKESREIAFRHPFRELRRLRRDVERMFEDFPRLALRWPQSIRRLAEELEPMAPTLDLYEEKDAIVAKAEVPGMHKEDLEVSITGDLLTLRGEKQKEEKIEEKDYHYAERSYGSFTRTVRLPTEIQADKATATLRDGVLEMRFPKTEEAKRETVSVKVE
jgi:HSP20 family protein